MTQIDYEVPGGTGPGGLGVLGMADSVFCFAFSGNCDGDFAQFGLLGPAPFGISGAKLEPPTV